MKKLLYNKWVILFFNVIVFALMAWLLPIHFEENDDVSMCMIANGVYSGVPDGHLVFINALYGWIVAGLYRLTRIVEWYTLSFCVLHILSMTGIVYLVLRDDRMNSVIKVFLLIVLYVLWARVIIAFQFTTTAGLLCFSGCLALLHSNRKWKVVGVGAVFVASLIRFQAAGLVGLMCAPLFLIEFFRERSIASWALLAILFVLAGRLSEQLFYMQPEWAEYKAYDAIRGGINDNPNGYLSELDMPEDVNIEDYELLFVWHQGDRGVLTYPRMKELKAKIDERGIPYDCIMLRIRQVFKSYRVWWMLVFEGLLLIVLLNVVNMRQKQKNSSRFERDVFATDKYWLYGVSLGFLVFVALAVYVCLTGMLKHRVFW